MSMNDVIREIAADYWAEAQGELHGPWPDPDAIVEKYWERAWNDREDELLELIATREQDEAAKAVFGAVLQSDVRPVA